MLGAVLIGAVMVLGALAYAGGVARSSALLRLTGIGLILAPWVTFVLPWPD